MAYVTCWRVKPVPMKALKAVEEPKKMQPMTNTIALLATSDHTGTFSF